MQFNTTMRWSCLIPTLTLLGVVPLALVQFSLSRRVEEESSSPAELAAVLAASGVASHHDVKLNELRGSIDRMQDKIDQLIALVQEQGAANAAAAAQLSSIIQQEKAVVDKKLLLESIDKEWTPDSMPDQVATVNEKQLRSAVSNVNVHIPGVENRAFRVPFFKHAPSWLAQRTFTSDIFFCPPNGHEGTITHLIGQLLYLGLREATSSSDDGVVGSFMDVGSNLGFYSLLAIDMGVPAYAFDIQPLCLYNLYSLAQTNPQRRHHLHPFNVGMADAPLVVTNAEGGCDYENFYVADQGEDANNSQKASQDTGKGVQVPVVRMDDWIHTMKDQLPLPIRVLKMDTEGAEGRIVLGMQETLAAPCTLLNWIVELTPAHWFRFGQTMEDENAIQAYVDVVEKHNYKAYLMYMPVERRPPPALHDFMKPLSAHPAMPGQTDTGCEGAPYYEILDMRRFFVDYCLTFLAGVKRPGGSSKGFCGNVWFKKQSCALSSNKNVGTN